MSLDVPTLSVVTVFVTALLGALLVFAGLQNRSVRALMWWGMAHVVGSVGLGLLIMRGSVSDFLSIDAANALMLVSYGVTWAGARAFDGRRVQWWTVLVAPALWLVASHLPIFEDDINSRVFVISFMLAVLLALSAYEFWRGVNEPLLSRWPAIVVLLVYATMMLTRIPVLYFVPLANDGLSFQGTPFTVFAFGTLLYTVVMAFLLLNMTKERTELQHKIASLVDPLTGIVNRRGFFGGIADMFAQQQHDKRPIAILVFDLDRFKEINDHLGHAVGDRVLRVFGDTGTATLGADILFGRIGGEEFAALVPVGDIDEGFAIADRVRRNFASAAARHGSRDLKPTVSAGIALGYDFREFEAYLADADRALYRAKEHGRNRVELACISAPASTGAPSIVPQADAERVDAPPAKFKAAPLRRVG
jgi:diguanylate cyclase (GGDEF)-like protein